MTPQQLHEHAAGKDFDANAKYNNLIFPVGMEEIPDSLKRLNVKQVQLLGFKGPEIELRSKAIELLYVGGKNIETIKINENSAVKIKQEKDFNKIVVKWMRGATVVREHAPANHFFSQPLRPEDNFPSPNNKYFSKHMRRNYVCRDFASMGDEYDTDDEIHEKQSNDVGLAKYQASLKKGRFGDEKTFQSLQPDLQARRHHRLKSNSFDRTIFSPDQLGQVMFNAFNEMGASSRTTALFNTPQHSMRGVLQRRVGPTGIVSYHALVDDINSIQSGQVATENINDAKNWKAADFFPSDEYSHYLPSASPCLWIRTPRGLDKEILTNPLSNAEVKLQQLRFALDPGSKRDASLMHQVRELGENYFALMPEMIQMPTDELIDLLQHDFVRQAIGRENPRVIRSQFSMLKTLAMASKLNGKQVAENIVLAKRAPVNGALIPSIHRAIAAGDADVVKAYVRGIQSLVSAKLLKKEHTAEFLPLWSDVTVDMVKASVADPSAPNHLAARAYADLLRLLHPLLAS